MTIKVNPKLIKSLKSKFDLNFNDIEPKNMEFFNFSNVKKCPYILIKYKIGLQSKYPNSTTNLFCLVDESKNLLISGSTNKTNGNINLSSTELLYP
jgi:hypothetical protein